MVLDAQEERQRRCVGVGARCGTDHLVGAVRQSGSRARFEGEHVGHGGDSVHAFTKSMVASRQQDRSAGKARRHMVERGDGVVEGHGDPTGNETFGLEPRGERLEGLAIGLERSRVTCLGAREQWRGRASSRGGWPRRPPIRAGRSSRATDAPWSPGPGHRGPGATPVQARRPRSRNSGRRRSPRQRRDPGGPACDRMHSAECETVHALALPADRRHPAAPGVKHLNGEPAQPAGSAVDQHAHWPRWQPRAQSRAPRATLW